MFVDQKNQFCKKEPGQVDGKMFKIKGCIESNLYVHDFHDTAQVLNCENSVIVMGPNSQSIFIRDCKNCKLVVTCKQLRIRDCEGLMISLYAQTEPVIESSKRIKILPHQYVYEELFGQMLKANLSIWNNKYTEVFDFTPKSTGGLNYELIVSSKRSKQEQFVDLYNFEKVVNNYEKKNNAKLQDVNDLEAIFGDASFYKEDEEIQESEYDMDKFYKIPLTYGKASIENEGKYTPLTVIFWYQTFEIMMNEKDLEVALGFTDGLKDFFDPAVEDGEEETENLILKRTRSTPLTKE